MTSVDNESSGQETPSGDSMEAVMRDMRKLFSNNCELIEAGEILQRLCEEQAMYSKVSDFIREAHHLNFSILNSLIKYEKKTLGMPIDSAGKDVVESISGLEIPELKALQQMRDFASGEETFREYRHRLFELLFGAMISEHLSGDKPEVRAEHVLFNYKITNLVEAAFELKEAKIRRQEIKSI